MRPKDHMGQKVDNTPSFQKLIEVSLQKMEFISRLLSKGTRSRCFLKEYRAIILKLRL